MADHHEILLYAVSTCSHCQAMMDFLNKNSFHFKCTYVDELFGKERREAIGEVKKVNKRCSFPTTLVDGEVVVGFKEDELRKVLGI